MEAELWLSPMEAARSLDVHVQYVRKLMRQGKLTHIWTSLGRLIDPASIDEFRASWVQRARHKPTNNG
jgi:excisionase family DNA binding protein